MTLSGTIKVEELMRGSLIEYQEERPFHKNKGKWFIETVWGTTTDDETMRDVVEIGKFGCNGYIDISTIKGIPITEVLLLEYGFIPTSNSENLLTFYRDDFGFIRLSTYGIEHVYMFGKPILYLHNFQRIFFDYTRKSLHPKISEAPKDAPVFSFEPKKKKSGKQILSDIKDMSARIIDTVNIAVDVDLDFSTVEYKKTVELLKKVEPVKVIEKPKTIFDLDF